jgi:hypothetical protein
MMIAPHVVHSSFASLAQVLYPEERLFPLSWSTYLGFGIFYSVLMFFDEIPREKREIFSKRNKMSLTQVLLIHISFLALLFLGLRVSSRLVPYLPPWMANVHDLGDAYTSGADLIVFFGVLLLFVCEKIWLQSGTTESESPQE